MHKSEALRGSSKYGPSGNFGQNMLKGFNIPDDRKAILAQIANHGLAKKTWSTYKTAERMLRTCEKVKKKRTTKWTYHSKK